MKYYTIIGCLLFLLISSLSAVPDYDSSTLFCERLDSYDNLEEAYKDAQDNNRLLMVIIFKSWCGACIRLKRMVCHADDFIKESENFVVVALGEYNHPADRKYAPDGKYTPRILFVYPNGTVMVDQKNQEVSGIKFQYSYYTKYQLLTSMQSALTKYYG